MMIATKVNIIKSFQKYQILKQISFILILQLQRIAMFMVPLILIFGSYIVISIILFFFPSLIHPPHKYARSTIFAKALSGQNIIRIAHRGGPRIKTENTIEAFEQAMKYSDMLEMDVCQTKDGVLVVHHDHDLQRTCGIKEHIRNLEFKDLPEFKKNIELNFAPQGLTVESKGEKIPTLKEVFSRFQNVPMNIELKTPSLKAIKELVDLIKEHKRRNITFVGIRGQLQQQLVNMDHKLMRFMGDSQFYLYFIGLIFGFLPYLYVSESTMQIPLWTEESYHWKIREWGDTWKVHFFFKAIKISNYIARIMAYHLRKRGVMTYYWVCNSYDDFSRAMKFGANGIMTDNPPLLAKYLAEIGQKDSSKVQQINKDGKVKQN